MILLLEVADPWGNLNSFADPYKTYRRIIRPDAKVITIGMREVYLKANFQDFQRHQAVDLPIGGDVQATLPEFVMDGGAPQDSDADRDAQQPLLPSGDHARCAHGGTTQPAATYCAHRH